MEEFEWRWHQDYRKRSVRAAEQYKHILDGPCCYPCRYLERFLAEADRPQGDACHHTHSAAEGD
jgi:hypothetical protein